MKLHITEQGDWSVGIPERHYDIDCPFEKDEINENDLDLFRSEIISTFAQFAEMKMTAEYDFELNYRDTDEP